MKTGSPNAEIRRTRNSQACRRETECGGRPESWIFRHLQLSGASADAGRGGAGGGVGGATAGLIGVLANAHGEVPTRIALALRQITQSSEALHARCGIHQ